MAETLQSAIEAGKRASASHAEREERIANAEMEWTDGALSTWAEGLTMRKGALAEELLAAGGEWYFWRVDLIDATTGEKIDAKLIDGQYGKCWMLSRRAEYDYGTKFITAHAKREATMVKKGVREKVTIFKAAATVYIGGSGRGLAGATSCFAGIRTADSSIEFTGTCGGGTRESAESHAGTLKRYGYGWQQIEIEA